LYYLKELFSDYEHFDKMLKNTKNSGGVFFISDFNSKLGYAFVGLKTNTTKAQMLRAIIDSIVYSIKTSYNLLLRDLKTYKIKIRTIK
jgi:glycerol kinase